jgi:hypothetical protein
MKRDMFPKFMLLISLLALGQFVFSQDDDSPIDPPFETITLIDNQTTMNLYQGGLVMEIQHRFSKIEELADLFGIYGSANTRIAMDYGITDKIMVGFGTTRDYMLQDLEWKYNIFTQTTSGRIPVSLSYFGNAVLDAREKDNFGPEEDYKFIHRLSYLTQVIVSRKFGESIALQMAPTFVFYNSVPEGYENINYSLNFGGRFQFLGYHSIILEYDQPLMQTEEDVYPNIGVGVEIGTGTHSFRIFASNYNAIVKNRNVAFNPNNPFDGDWQFGFNISIRFR